MERVKLMQLNAQQNTIRGGSPDQALAGKIKAVEAQIDMLNESLRPTSSVSSYQQYPKENNSDFILEAPPSPQRAKKLRKAQSARSLASTKSLVSIPESEASVETILHRPNTPSRKRSWGTLRRTKSNLSEYVPFHPLLKSQS
jgi:hypothetical protein